MTIRVMPWEPLQRSHLLSVSVKEPSVKRAVATGLRWPPKVGLNLPVLRESNKEMELAL